MNRFPIDKPCPLCGKPMAEEPKFLGLWICPDGKIRINDEPPYRFQCEGMELTDEGRRAFDAAMWRQHMMRN